MSSGRTTGRFSADGGADNASHELFRRSIGKMALLCPRCLKYAMQRAFLARSPPPPALRVHQNRSPDPFLSVSHFLDATSGLLGSLDSRQRRASHSAHCFRYQGFGSSSRLSSLKLSLSAALITIARRDSELAMQLAVSVLLLTAC